MSAQSRPLVSFVVPTLNRGRYVVRAVDSCLNVDREEAGVDVEVVVLDSESDDGSWEELQARFGGDPRVTLAQNRRGLGPTRSWLDGARLARGDFITYLWSDDYVSPRFLSVLVPALRDGAALSVGQGHMRDLDNDTDLPQVSGSVAVDHDQFVTGYFRRGIDDGIIRPVSPACSLFSRQAFVAWIEVAEDWCQATPLRQNLHWRRAIGPDLLLFLVSAHMTPGDVVVSNEITAQFSHHPESFSVAASRWSYETGYWLARLWVPQSQALDSSCPAQTFGAHAGALIGIGLYLAVSALGHARSNGIADAAAILDEIWHLWRIALRQGMGLRVSGEVRREIFRLLVLFFSHRQPNPETLS